MDDQNQPPKSTTATKNHRNNRVRWGVVALVIVVIGVAGYFIYKSQADNVGKIVATSGQYSEADLDVCLDGQKNVTITKDFPLKFDTGDSSTSGTVSLLLANHILSKTNGDFEVGSGSDKGMHHIDRDFCRY